MEADQLHHINQARQASLILESIPDAYLSIDQDWCCVYLNQTMEQLMRMRREEVLGHDMRELFANQYVVENRLFYHQAMYQRTAVTFECWYPSRGMWAEVRIFPDQNNGITVCYRDVTAQKQTEQKLHESEELFGLLNENLRDYALIILDVNGNVIDWNLGAARMFGFTDEEMLGQNIRRVFTPEDQAARVSDRELRKAGSIGRARR